MPSDMTLDLALKILVAIVLGGVIGWQREMAHKPAGLRTHILIVLGATVVMETSRYAGQQLGGDPTRMASNIIVGIGFIGAGTIMKEGPTVYGLTTAATIWVAGALGTSIGAGYYGAAVLLTASTLLVLGVFGRLEFAGKRRTVRRYVVAAEEPADEVLARIRAALEKSRTRRTGIDFRREGGRISLSFDLAGTAPDHEALFTELRAIRDVVELRSS